MMSICNEGSVRQQGLFVFLAAQQISLLTTAHKLLYPHRSAQRYVLVKAISWRISSLEGCSWLAYEPFKGSLSFLGTSWASLPQLCRHQATIFGPYLPDQGCDQLQCVCTFTFNTLHHRVFIATGPCCRTFRRSLCLNGHLYSLDLEFSRYCFSVLMVVGRQRRQAQCNVL